MARAGHDHGLRQLHAAKYELKVLPETSLAFGLGIAYFAFADRVRCWNDLVGDPAFVDGMGYIKIQDMYQNGLNVTELLGNAIVIHWSGRTKPFNRTAAMDAQIVRPYDAVWEYLQEENGLEPFNRVAPLRRCDDTCEAQPSSDSTESAAECALATCTNCAACFARDKPPEPAPTYTPPEYKPPADKAPPVASCGMFCGAHRSRNRVNLDAVRDAAGLRARVEKSATEAPLPVG